MEIVRSAIGLPLRSRWIGGALRTNNDFPIYLPPKRKDHTTHLESEPKPSVFCGLRDRYRNLL